MHVKDCSKQPKNEGGGGDCTCNQSLLPFVDGRTGPGLPLFLQQCKRANLVPKWIKKNDGKSKSTNLVQYTLCCNVSLTSMEASSLAWSGINERLLYSGKRRARSFHLRM